MENTDFLRGCGAVVSAFALQAKGRGFKPLLLQDLSFCGCGVLFLPHAAKGRESNSCSSITGRQSFCAISFDTVKEGSFTAPALPQIASLSRKGLRRCITHEHPEIPNTMRYPPKRTAFSSAVGKTFYRQYRCATESRE